MEADMARLKKEIARDEAALEKAKKAADEAAAREADLKNE